MVIKDKIVSWYIKNVLLPGSEKLNNPGFILSDLGGKGKKEYIREVVFPEKIFIDIENELLQRHGNKAAEVLYAAGKKYSYAYFSISNLPAYGETSQKEWSNLMEYSISFTEAIYASEITRKWDVELKRMELDLRDFIVCSKNGYGYLLTSGETAGSWAYMINDPTVESVQTKCQGKGDTTCHLICAPKETLEKMGLNYFTCENLEKVKLTPEYFEINSVKQNKYSTLSFQSLINSKIFSYSHGQVSFEKERYFIDNPGLLDFLENELKKLPEGNRIVFEKAFEYSKEMLLKFGGAKKSLQFIMDLLSAFGWGDVLIKKNGLNYDVIISHFPWTPEAKNSGLHFFSGLLSGYISAFEGKDINMSKKSESLINKDYIVLFKSQ